MTRRAIVCVATGNYVKGQDRLRATPYAAGAEFRLWRNILPTGSPTHDAVPYAFKAVAMRQVADQGYNTLLWADACIKPIRSMEPLWERIERDGYWFSRNGWQNSEWCADSAYPDLFPECAWLENGQRGFDLQVARAENHDIPHVVATSFGISIRHDVGKRFLEEYYRLATTTRAFCGPWINANAQPNHPVDGKRCAPCGPPDVLGHRHDQVAASVLAWRLGMELTSAPEWFAYAGGEDERTVLVADGAY